MGPVYSTDRANCIKSSLYDSKVCHVTHSLILVCLQFSLFSDCLALYCASSGNHERDWPGSGSFYGNLDSGGECGVLAQTMFYVPAENREKFWYNMSIF